MKKFFSLCLMTMAAASLSAAELPFTVDPASGTTVSSIDVITFTLNPGEYDVFQVDSYGFHFDKDGQVVCAAVVEEDYNVLRVSPETPITETGTYDLVIDSESLVAWSMTGGMYYNKEDLVFTYTVSEPTSIELNTINTDNAKKGVFNLQGIKVANSAEGLPAGIYIINGKKSVVR